MPHGQARRTQLGRQQFLEPQGRRVTPAGKLGHEDDTALLDLLRQRFQLGQFVGQRQTQYTGLRAAHARAIG